MNRVKYTTPVLLDNESTVVVENNIRLYDGDQKVCIMYSNITFNRN